MGVVLVVVDAADGSVPKPTLELLTLARRVGEPAAVVFGPSAGDAVGPLGAYGAVQVFTVADQRVVDHLVVAKVDALEQIAGQVGEVAAVLLTASPEGKEIGARLALRLGSGFISNAVDVAAGEAGEPRWWRRIGVRGVVYGAVGGDDGGAGDRGEAECDQPGAAGGVAGGA